MVKSYDLYDISYLFDRTFDNVYSIMLVTFMLISFGILTIKNDKNGFRHMNKVFTTMFGVLHVHMIPYHHFV